MSESLKEVDKGFNGVDRASVSKRLLETEGFSVKSPSSVSSADYSQDLEQPAKQHQEMGAALQELSPPRVSGRHLPLASPPRKTSTLSVPVPGRQSQSPLHSEVYALSTPSPPSPISSQPRMVHCERPVEFSAPSPAGDTTPLSCSPKTSRAPPAVSQSRSVTLTHPPTGHVPLQTVPLPLEETQRSKSPVSPSPQYLSVVTTPPRLSPLKRPQEASPLTGQSPKHPAASSTPATDGNNIDLSAHSVLLSSASTVTAAPPAVSSFPRAPTASPSVSPAPKVSDSLTGSTAHYVDASENTDVSSHKVRVEADHQTSQETLSKHEVCDSPSKAGVVSKQEPNNEAHGRNLEPAFIIPKKDSISLVKKDRHNMKGQTTPGKGESDTFDDTFGTDTSVDYPSLAESSYLESSRVEGVSSMMDTFDDSFSLSQTEDPSKFTEGSMTDEASCVEENLNSSMTSTCSSGETSLRNTTSLLDDSFNESSQNNSSLLSASVNVSAQSIKGEILNVKLNHIEP